MTVDQVIAKLTEIKTAEGGNVPVVFDTEARQFDVHVVDVNSVDLIPSGIIDEAYVVLHWDHSLIGDICH